MSRSRAWRVRRRFLAALGRQLQVIWPILYILFGTELVLGFVVARLEHWPWGDGIWFAFVTFLTIGYGDLVPRHPLSRAFAVVLGLIGICVTALLAAVSVRALQEAIEEGLPSDPGAAGSRAGMTAAGNIRGGEHGPEGDRDRGADGRHGHQAAESQPADPAR